MTAPYTEDFSLIDLALADQRDMSAVERYSNFFETARAQQPTYRKLIPLTRPKPGEQYAFVVDMDRCSGCKACVSACHSLNGLEEGEMWRTVGTLIGEDSPALQTVTASCHHCLDPACASGCPVLAYEKDPHTGIVRHLDDQCIGCQYCVLKCPYDVPKYSKTKGIVRKCDMCHSRLAVGEAPACAQACPHEAIRIEIVSHDPVRTAALAPGARMVPGAFPSSYTLPTTKYISAKAPLSRIRSACTETLRLENPHWPLIWMLILTQLTAGIHLTGSALLLSGKRAPYQQLSIAAAFALGIGLVASIFHLGRPLKAWRAFLGWRQSWMSREIIAFSLYALFTAFNIATPANHALLPLTAFLGCVSVFCSAMIYVDTQRAGWSAKTVFPSFLGTTAILGSTFCGALSNLMNQALTTPLLLTAAITQSLLFAWRISNLATSGTPLFRLSHRTLPAMIALFGTSIVFTLLAVLNPQATPITAYFTWLACASTIASQILDRWTFFVGTPAPRMPSAFTP